jgi:peroxin-19
MYGRLMELMFDMQQYGQPPAEIIKDLAPGLKFDENGMPIMVRSRLCSSVSDSTN